MFWLIAAKGFFSEKITGSFIGPRPAATADFLVLAYSAFAFQVFKIAKGQEVF